jgi:hypothetical protein
MMGASVRCNIPMNHKVADSRVQNMQVLEWTSDVKNVLTEGQLIYCSNDLGNCSESVSWEAIRGQQETCRFVHMHPLHTQGSSTIEDKETMFEVPACAEQNGRTLRHEDNSILVDAFERFGRSRIGTFIGCGILNNSDPKELIDYITSFAEFGFNHNYYWGDLLWNGFFRLLWSCFSVGR